MNGRRVTPGPSQRPASRLTAIATALLCTIVVGCGGSMAAGRFETAKVARGDLVSRISATGTLSAVSTVTVGTQVSGTIARVLADFNDHVSAGDLLAVIDTEVLDASVRDAEAGLNRARAALRQAEAEVHRARAQLAQAEAQQTEAGASLRRHADLFDTGLMSAQEFEPRETAAASAAAGAESARAALASSDAGVASARASVTSAEAALAQVQKNRRNAEIRAPISGVVIQRSVDAGQTVAASFSTPTLFVIAEDLARMEIHAQVDESDIGRVEPGQAVEFTVAAYPERTFRGTVRERRLQPETVQNVVHYTVLIEAGNDDGLLLPGMTATADFVVERLDNVLLVPSAAIRFEPPPDLRSTAREKQRRGDGAASEDGAASGDDAPALTADAAELWVPLEEGGIRPLVVKVLGADGTQTAIAAIGSTSASIDVGRDVVTRVADAAGRGLR